LLLFHALKKKAFIKLPERYLARAKKAKITLEKKTALSRITSGALHRVTVNLNNCK
jgi:hypothetical protein